MVKDICRLFIEDIIVTTASVCVCTMQYIRWHSRNGRGFVHWCVIKTNESVDIIRNETVFKMFFKGKIMIWLVCK